jgi:hypothetical protein
MRPTKEELREYDTAELNFKKSLGDIPFSEIQKKTQDFKNKWFSGQKEPVVEEPVVEVKEEPVVEETVVEVKEEPVVEETVVEVKEEPVEEPEEGEIVEDTPEEKSSDEEIPY